MNAINAKTRVCALIGDPVEHSFSPLVHNAGFQELGLNLVYVAFQVKDIENALEGMKALNILGASVTIPHKIKAINHMDTLDEMARRIGSINTIVNQNGRLKGFNSDGMGALKAFRDQRIPLDGRKVVVLGSGGAARAIVFALIMNAKLKDLLILGIIKEEVDVLIRDLRKTTGTSVQGALMDRETLRKHISGSDIVINATPVGMSPHSDESPVPAHFLRQELIVFDVVYNPLRTKLLNDAQQCGCHTISGIEMFINQAVVQFELWTGRPAPEPVMRKVIMDQVSEK